METDSSFRKSDIYARVTDEIVKAIEAGAPEFEMPWHQRAEAGIPRNAQTGNGYRGINTLALWSAARLRGYTLPYWASFRQWTNLGARIRRGEKSTIIVFFKRTPPSDDDKAQVNEQRSKIILRYSSVFNATQVDGWQYPEAPATDRTEHLGTVDDFITGLGAEIQYGSTAAYYSRRFDRIHMPARHDFVKSATRTETEGFYSVLLHEHIHWSGHPKRLDRNLTGQFGDAAYAMEELTAELGAAFLCAEFGISVHSRRDHAAYVASWLAVLRQQKAAVFRAASSATIACAFLLARAFLPEQESAAAMPAST